MTEGDRAATCTGSPPVYNGVPFSGGTVTQEKKERKGVGSKMSLIIYRKSIQAPLLN
jgi:hypothetical protein